MKSLGAISVDMDPVNFVYKAVTNISLSDNDITYRKIVPRFLDYFKKNDIKATFFIIGSQIKKRFHREVLQDIASHGHELANHTYNHPFNFSKLSYETKEEEISLCEDIVKEATGMKTVGFRAPGWDIDNQTISILEKKRYLYDSSLFPSYFSYIMTFYLAFKNRKLPHSRSVGRFEYTFAPQKPYHPDKNKIWLSGDMNIYEFPISATPFLRIPFFGSFLFSTKSRLLFKTSYASIKRRNPLNYELHAVELYSKSDDAVPKEVASASHPCLKLFLKEKLKWYDIIFNKFKLDYTLVPIKELIEQYRKSKQ